MARKILPTVAGAILAVTCFVGASSAAPISPVDIGQGVRAELESVSFWARPFPYGYAQRHHRCVRYVRVGTRHGYRMRQVWVCRGGSRALSVRG
jgi:hypothetical protein